MVGSAFRFEATSKGLLDAWPMDFLVWLLCPYLLGIAVAVRRQQTQLFNGSILRWPDALGDTTTMTIQERKTREARADDLMSALVCERYGTPDVLKFVSRPRPSPEKDELLIRVMASTITSGDRRVRSLDVPKGFRTLGRLVLGWHGPRNAVLGVQFAGVVVATGSRVKGFVVGDAIFGISGFRMGSHAEYLCLPAQGAIARKPETSTFEESAAMSFGGGTALYFLRRANLLSGQTILVNGASGNVGMAAVQLARDMGGKVTGVCSAVYLDQVRVLGAEKVIDYAQEDFTNLPQRFDVVFDVACNRPVKRCLNVLKPGGRLIRLLSDLPEMCRAMLPRRDGLRVIAGNAEERADYLEDLADLVRQGRYRPLVARVYPFDEAIEAHRYADLQNHGGSVVIKMKDVSKTEVLYDQ